MYGSSKLVFMEDEFRQVAEEFAEVYSVLSEDSMSPEDLEVGAVDSLEDEASVRLPYLDINIVDWREWSPEKKLEVYVHEYAHTVDYSDDHQITFWDRVAEYTQTAIQNINELENALETKFDEEKLVYQVIESVHSGVIEPEMQSSHVEDYLEEALLPNNY